MVWARLWRGLTRRGLAVVPQPLFRTMSRAISRAVSQPNISGHLSVPWLGSDSVLFSLMFWGVLALLLRGVDTLGGFLRVGVLLVSLFSLMIWSVSSSMMDIVSSRVFIRELVCLSLVCVLFVFFNVSMGFIPLSFCVSLMSGIISVMGIGCIMSIMGIIYLEGRGSLGLCPKMPPHGALIYKEHETP